MTDQTSDVDSDYHSITKPAFEKDPWDHDYYDFVDAVDANLKMSGTIANRPADTDAPDNAWYEATDENLIYRNDPTNGWEVIGFGTSGNRVPSGFFDSLDANTLTAVQNIVASAINSDGTYTVSTKDSGDNDTNRLQLDSGTDFVDATLEAISNVVLDGDEVDVQLQSDAGGNASLSFYPDGASSPEVTVESNSDGTFSLRSDKNSLDIISLNSAHDAATSGIDFNFTGEVEKSGNPVGSLIESPNGNIQSVQLEAQESSQITVPVPDGKQLTVYRWGAYELANNSNNSDFQVRFLDTDGSYFTSEYTLDTVNSGGIHTQANSSGSLAIYRLSVYNDSGNTHDVGAHFAYRIEDQP